MADYFTKQARDAIRLAYEAARDIHNNYIGTEHLLLGLMRQGSGVAARVLEENEVTEKRVLELMDRLISPQKNVAVQDEP